MNWAPSRRRRRRVRAAVIAAGRRFPRGTRRGALIATFALLLPVSAATAGVLEQRLGATRAASQQVKHEIVAVDQRQQVVAQQISSLNRRIADLDAPLFSLQGEIDALDYRIGRRTQRIADLKHDYVAQQREIVRLGEQLQAARDLLNQRVVAAYTSGDSGMVQQLAGAGSLRDLLDREEALGQVVGLDSGVIDQIASTERAVRVERARNHQMRDVIRADIASLAADRTKITAQRDEAKRRRDDVAAAKAQRDALLRQLNSREHELSKRLDSLEEDATVLKRAIDTGQQAYGNMVGGVSPAGLIWPVQGPIASPFGWRWGRMHEGIDIAIAAGNPIHAAASGVVTYAGWMSGYGNMVIIQHAGGLSTGYAHQSRIASGVGQLVAQGQVIGYVGCTGHCFGDHVHFETRLNGVARDPMQYL